ncbi:aspergillopepsin A precursor [Pyrenophora seminiperda CCB06]|uniref:Aspergillopepsin A n=1 Tax=Pyrenophora seminiperda CCB06 TaxID=1302712 RepID=A0A3M7MGE5_9PLEO|nr:aspergillopepsin A precursor [Pyrenophora seminiperda CCB06]
MLSFPQVTAILAFTSAVVAAKPIRDDTASTTFLLDQPPGSKHLLTRPMEMLRVKRRYNIPVDEKLVAAAERQARRMRETFSLELEARGDGQGVVGMTPQDRYDSGAVASLVIGEGEEGKMFRMLVGTASADFWVFSSLQPKDQLRGHRYYIPDESKRMQNYTFFQGYDGGSMPAEGLVYKDTVTLGNLSTTQIFAAATNVSRGWLDIPNYDGIIGLGFKDANSITPGPQNTFFDNIRPSLAAPLFATCLRSHARGSIDFGYIDTEKVDGAITYIDVLEDGWGVWGYIGNGFAIGSDSSQITQRVLRTYLDMSTSTMFTQPDIVAAYWSRVTDAHLSDEEQGYIYPCNATHLPQISFSVNGARQLVQGDAMRTESFDKEGKWCFGGLQNIRGGVDFSLFGYNFMKDRFVVHEIQEGGEEEGWGLRG